jgi:hypothetical protein
MKSKTLLFCMCCIVTMSNISCQNSRAVVTQTENLSIGLTIYPSNISVDTVRNAIESNLAGYYRLKLNVIAFPDFDTIMNGVNKNAEQYVKNFLNTHQLNYLVYVRNRRNRDLWLEVWNQDGILENIGIPYSKHIENQLIDISTNAFISIIENLDNRLYRNKLY